MMPVAFFGHGAPTNTLATNRYTRAWRTYAAALPAPRAILMVSAHWYVPGLRVTGAARPETVHDFNGGFPRALFDFRYPAPGSRELAERVMELLAPARVLRDDSWGFDHGAYSVLAHLFPAADVPVVQLDLDRALPARRHYQLARRLAPLRDEGVLIAGSGNLVHNLELAEFGPGVRPSAWAERYQERLLEFIRAGDHERLIDYRANGSDAKLSIPTPDHYLPFLYVLAQQRAGESLDVLVQGVEAASISMLSLGTR
jgi:4,5-DOPA dioxygenase extradiol